ncbi:hypothetical protein CDD83_1504 [Cordyceps sp. RAO-2017]|nr:hypothetical protein CDD83_1504 [Cordyceps sp. RAO-2017]
MASSPAFEADASRPQSGILTPSSEGGLNRSDDGLRGASHGQLEKRREDVAAMNHLLKASIAVKPHPSQLHVQPRLLLPLMLLPREHLPLALIDFTASERDLPASRMYESHVKILDLESRLGSAPSVLLARNEIKGSVHALERQDDGLYAMCQLGSWADIASLAGKATALSHDRLRPARTQPVREHASGALTTPQIHKEQRKKRAAIEAIQSLVRKRARSMSVPAFGDGGVGAEAAADPSPLPCPETKQERQTETPLSAIAPAADAASGPATASPLASQNAADIIFTNIRTQYLEALYRSMGSLAYFAKGPLSRARSAFHLDLESNLEMAHLIDFLKSLILTTVQIDKKYRETIPDVISKMKTGVDSSEENGTRRRRPKKMKIGRGGLYPFEDESVRRWWATQKPELDENQSSHSASQIKSHVSLLRTRETQLQMILILEILALEPLKAANEACENNSLPQLPGAESRPQEQSPSAPPPQKRRNKHNLPVLIDVHADRLTIWQSTASDEQLQLEDSQVLRGPSDGQARQKPSAEPLRDFCVDIVVPFFSARLPELCDSINRKLGGPVIVTPLKSKSSKQPGGRREQQKPGAAAKRPDPVDNRRTLQRALSTEQQHRRSVSRGPGNAIALMRSATSTSLASIKREGSEPAALRAIPQGGAKPPPRRQPPLSRSASASSLVDAKANKKAMVEAELKDAISALRKPNREPIG